MDPLVFAAVLLAAACHAGWNATIKGGLDPLATTVLISIGAAVVAAAFLPLVGLPARDAWPWCGASVLIHLVYFAALIESYRAGDMGQVYPIARGSAPLMTAIATTAFIGERLGLLGWSGILLLVAGVMLLSLRGGRDLARLDTKAVALIAIVAALRETSVLFGAVIAVTFRKEPLRAGRVVAGLMIVAGLTLIRLY